MPSDKICMTGERIRELYESHGYSQKDFADFLGISTAQLRRFEKNPDQPIRSDILIKIAQRFDVSVDYLLVLTPVTKNNHEITQLHLSEVACEKLIRGEINGDTLSRMMEHQDFGKLIHNASAFFNDTYVDGVLMRNQILSEGASFLHRHAQETDHPNDVHTAANNVLISKTKAHEIEMTDIRILLERILRQTKEKIDSEKASSVPAEPRKAASKEMVTRVAQIVEESHAKTELTRDEQIDYSADRIVEEISAETGLKGTSIRILKPVFRFIFRMTGKDEKK